VSARVREATGSARPRSAGWSPPRAVHPTTTTTTTTLTTATTTAETTKTTRTITTVTTTTKREINSLGTRRSEMGVSNDAQKPRRWRLVELQRIAWARDQLFNIIQYYSNYSE